MNLLSRSPDPAKILLQAAVQPQREPQGHLARHGVGQDEEAARGLGLLLPRRSGKHQRPGVHVALCAGKKKPLL